MVHHIAALLVTLGLALSSGVHGNRAESVGGRDLRPIDHTITISEEEFQPILEEATLAFVFFTSEAWEGGALDSFEQAAKVLKDTMWFVVADHTVSPIPFPDTRMALCIEGQCSSYDGDVDKESITLHCLKAFNKYMDSTSSLRDVPSQPIESLSASVGLLETEGRAVIAFLANAESSQIEAYRTLTHDRSSEIPFGHVKTAALATQFGVTKFPALLLGDNGDVRLYDGEWDADKMAAWVDDELFAPMARLTPRTFSRFYKTRPLLVFFTDATNPDLEDWRAEFIPVAKSFRDISFVYADSFEMDELVAQMGLKNKKMPAMGIMDPLLDTNYPALRLKVNPRATKLFCEAFRQGKVDPYTRSDVAPMLNGAEAVTPVVGMTFKEIVLDKEKDVLVMFTAPWCEECALLEEEYELVGEAMKRGRERITKPQEEEVSSYLKIASMDLSTNDVQPDYKQYVVSLPQVILFPREDKSKPVIYNGEMAARDILEFLRDESSVNIRLESREEELPRVPVQLSESQKRILGDVTKALGGSKNEHDEL